MRALIVDDSPAARELARVVLEDAFEAHGVDLPVEVADGGMAALKTIAEGDVVFLLCDLHMPDLQGLEVVSFWKQRAPEGAVAVIVTTAVTERDRERAFKAGASGFLNKPFTAEALAPFLEERAEAWRGA